ncbi:AMP-binding protein, partial [Acinetobacter baumannii]|nr:AMP-binding protein [Acinetobacter baumannii]
EALVTARRWGSFLTECTSPRKPVLVITDKTVTTPELFFAVLYSGCFYVPIDLELPKYRLKLILDTVQADIMVTDETYLQAAEELEFTGKIISTRDM